MNPNDNLDNSLPSPVNLNNTDEGSLVSAQQADSTIQVNSSSQLTAPTSQQGLNSSYSPQIADDADLIEKEWVMKAKEIVAKTRDNPNEQSKELSKFKADYLKKRFNKDVKISES